MQYELSNCSSCNIQFNSGINLPRTLICGHFFCSSCLNEQLHNDKIICSACQKITTVASVQDLQAYSYLQSPGVYQVPRGPEGPPSAPFQDSNFEKVQFDPMIQQDQHQQLRDAFAQIDTNKDGFLSFEEIFIALEKKGGPDVDRNYIAKVFHQMDFNRDGRIAMSEFINHYIAHTNVIFEAMSQLQQQMYVKKEQRSQAKSQLKQAEPQEKLNVWQIMEGSQVTVRVMEAQGLQKAAYYSVITCEKQRIDTKVIVDTNPIWDEAFTFNITRGQGELLVTVMRKDASDHFTGQAIVNLNDLRDQQKHNKWIQLLGTNSTSPVPGRILLSMQWIHSKVAYLREMIAKIDESLVQDEAEYVRYETELKKLGASPLGIFTEGEFQNLQNVENKVAGWVDGIVQRHFKNVSNWERVQFWF